MTRLAIAAALLTAAAALADVTLTLDAVTDGQPNTTTLQFKGKRALITVVRAEKTPGAKDAVILRDGEAKRMVLIDHHAKTYSELSDATAVEMKARAEAMRASMSDKLAGLPPEQRAKLEALMPKSVAAPAAPAAPSPKQYAFEKKGTSRKVAGKTCSEYVVKVDGVVDGDGCFIAWKDAGITRQALHDQVLAAMAGLPTATESLDATFTAETAPGLPAWRKRVDASGAVRSETTLKKLSTDRLDDAVFEVPKGYTARSMGPPPRP